MNDLDAIRRALRPAAAPQPTAQAHEAPPDQPLRILVAEDNPINQKLARHVLERARVVQTVHEFDDQDAYVLRGRRKKLAQRFRVSFEAAIAQRAELRDSLH